MAARFSSAVREPRALLQFERDGHAAGSRLAGDVQPVRAALRPVAGQAGRAGRAGHVDPARRVGLCPQVGGHGHGPGRGGRAGVFGSRPEKSGQRRRTVGDRSLEHAIRGPRHGQELANRLAAAAGDDDRQPPAGGVDAADEKFGGRRGFDGRTGFGHRKDTALWVRTGPAAAKFRTTGTDRPASRPRSCLQFSGEGGKFFHRVPRSSFGQRTIPYPPCAGRSRQPLAARLRRCGFVARSRVAFFGGPPR